MKTITRNDVKAVIDAVREHARLHAKYFQDVRIGSVVDELRIKGIDVIEGGDELDISKSGWWRKDVNILSDVLSVVGHLTGVGVI